MRTKLSRLKKDISLLKVKLHECRQIIHEKELHKTDNASFADTAPPPITYSTLALSEEPVSNTNL